MPRSSELRNNFTAGELSTNIDARSDFARYFNGSLNVQNFVIRPQGLISKRKGNRFIAETKDSTKFSALVEFTFSTNQTYVLEIGEGYIRFYSEQARVLENAKPITGATQANPVVITANAHGYSNGDLIVISDVQGMTELNGKEYTIANVTANTFELVGVDGTAFTAYTTGGNALKVHEISTPYLESELFDIRYVQDSDVIYLVHPNRPIQKLIRVSANQFIIEEVDLVKGPYAKENIVSTDKVTLSGGAPWTEGSTLTLTATGGHTPFSADRVGALWQLKSGSDIAHVKITGFTSSTVVTVEAKNDIPVSLQGTAIFTWSEGEFSDARGYAGAIAFHEQRLVLAGSRTSPQKVWFSNSNGDYENFEAGTEADDSFNIKIASLAGDPIRWLFSDNVLFVGTAGGVFRIRNSSNGSALSPTDIDVKKHISQGADIVSAQQVDSSVFYVQAGGQLVRSISFSVESDKYRAKDITIDADHITGSGIVESNTQQIPLSNLILIRQDGQIAELTLEQDQEINAWSRDITQGSYESSAIILDSSNREVLYFIVNRTINGVTKRFIEAREPNYLNDNLNAFYVDSGLTYNGTQNTTLTLSSASGSEPITTETGDPITTELGEVLETEEQDVTITVSSPTFLASDVGKEIHELGDNKGRALIIGFTDSQTITIDIIEAFSSSSILAGTWAIAIKTVTGLNHLIGETVSIASDGATEQNQVVDSNGQVTISSAGSIIHVGLPYTAKQTSMPLEALGLANFLGSSQGKEKRVDTVEVKFADTRGAEIVLERNGNLVPVPFRSVDNNMNEAVPLFNGDKKITLADGWGYQSIISIQQSEPQPITVKSITYKVSVNDK
jgi:hypothetical protein